MNVYDKIIKNCKDPAREELKSKQSLFEDFELPRGYRFDMESEDTYGLYLKDSYGRVYLAKVNSEDKRDYYEIRGGCFGILDKALSNQPFLKSIKIPASMYQISEGALSNAGSWARIEKGLTNVKIESGNERFFSDRTGVYERLENGVKLLLCLSSDKVIPIGKNVISIGKSAFYGRYVECVFFEANGFSYSFPHHTYFNEELLKSFGRNGKLYDFEAYDDFLLRDHFNADRIRMICERVTQGYEITPNKKYELISHIKTRMSEALMALAYENAADELRLMTEAGLFDSGNIDNSIEVLNRTDCRELLTYLMDYKHRNFKTEDFDFSI